MAGIISLARRLLRRVSGSHRTELSAARRMRRVFGISSHSVPFRPIHFYLIRACETWREAAGDVGPRILRISRMRGRGNGTIKEAIYTGVRMLDGSRITAIYCHFFKARSGWSVRTCLNIS